MKLRGDVECWLCLMTVQRKILFRIHRSNFTDNCVDVSKYKVNMAGGGMAVTLFRNSAYNNMYIAACRFDGNTVPTGGGILIYSEPLQEKLGRITPIPNKLFISGCWFMNNRGHIGAAMHIYCTSPSWCSTTLQC